MKRLLAIVLLVCGLRAARADEGMWTFDQFPSEKVKEKYGFAPSREWLDHVRLSSVRLAGGCSGSIVSPFGLVMTNHHCARSCIEQLSTAEKDWMAGGFQARSAEDEARCPEIEVNQLTEITDVTDRINAATRGLTDRKYNEAQKAEMSRIEKECAIGDEVRCDVVILYRGGRYSLYKYRRFQDVRLVFAPEAAIAFFGGDPDNFMFPRYDLDVAFLRIYENGKPARTDPYLHWSPSGANEGDLTFVSGHPGTTSRLYTVAQLEYERDVALPDRLLRLSEERGMLTEFQNRGPELARISKSALLGVENSLKGLKGRYEALLNKTFFASRVAAEQAFRERIDRDPVRKKVYGGAWGAIAHAKEEQKRIRKRYSNLEPSRRFWSTLMDHARTLVRSAEEIPKPNEKRLREFSDSRLPALRQRLFSTAPVYDDLEILNLAFALTKLREELGPDDPVVKKVLGQDSPRDLASALAKGTRLKEVGFRKALFDGGEAAVQVSTDPMIVLARRVDPDARAVRQNYEDEIEAVEKKNGELIARAQFDLYGTGTYPDATFTLRLSYGQVKGFPEDGGPVAPVTTLRGAFDRHAGKEPFALPASWLAARDRLDLDTPMDFCTTNDIIGGNSGSPVIDREARIVGLIFDGNIHSLGGDYGFDDSVNRAVAVHSAALLSALDKIYDARRLLQEIAPAASSDR